MGLARINPRVMYFSKRLSFSNSKNNLSMNGLKNFPLFLSLEAEGFGFEGGDEGVAIGVDLACYSVGVAAALEVAVDEDRIIFDGEDSSEFDNGELGLLGNVSKEVELEKSFSGLMAQARLLIPFRSKGEEGVMASLATEEGMGWMTEG